MTTVITIITVCASIAVGFGAGWIARGKRASRDVGRSAYVMCGFMMALRKGFDESRFDEIRESLTMQARSQHRVWKDMDGMLPQRDLAIDNFFRQADLEFSENRAA